MGGFHQLRVRQIILYNRHAFQGYKSWWVDAGMIAARSADKAAEGGHYYRNMRLHKVTFNALVQFRAQNVTANYEEMLLQKLRSEPNPERVKIVLENKVFNLLYRRIIRLGCFPFVGSSFCCP